MGAKDYKFTHSIWINVPIFYRDFTYLFASNIKSLNLRILAAACFHSLSNIEFCHPHGSVSSRPQNGIVGVLYVMSSFGKYC